MTEFRATLGEQLSAVCPPPPAAPTETLPVELWAMDESRFGLHTITRRRLTLRGVKPIGTHQLEFKNFYVYGLVAPRTGEGYFETRRTMKAEEFADFLTQFATQEAKRFHIILLDNARSHHATTLALPSNVALLYLPAYAPELNPCERVWQAIKDRLAWRTFPDLVALQDTVADLFAGYEDDTFASLVAYPFLCAAMDKLAA